MKNEEWELVFHFSLFINEENVFSLPLQGDKRGSFFILMRLQPVETKATISN